MTLDPLELIIDVTDSEKQGILQGFDSVASKPATILFRNDGENLLLRFVKPSSGSTRPWDDIASISTAVVAVGVGVYDLVPTSGTFTLTFGANTTTALAYNISASALSTALNLLASIIAAGGVTVAAGTNASEWVITFISTGLQALITGNGSLLLPGSNVAVYEEQAGSGSLQEVQVIGLLQIPAAYKNSWSSLAGPGAVVTPIQAGDATHYAMWQIALTPAPYDGSFTIITGAGSTPAIAHNALATDVQNALNAVTANGWSVSGNAGGPWTITRLNFAVETTPTVNASALIVPDGVFGVLPLNTLAMYNLFKSNPGINILNLILEISITFPSALKQTVLSIPCQVSRDLLNPVTMLSSALATAYTTAEADNNFIANHPAITVTGFTGGGPSNFDGIATVTRPVGQMHNALISSTLYFYELYTGTDATNVPTVIRPADYDGVTNQKVWKLAGVLAPDGDTTVIESGSTNIGNGVGSIAVVFGTVKSTANYIFEYLYLENLTDSAILCLGQVLARSTTGFTVGFSGLTTTTNWVLKWKVKV